MTMTPQQPLPSHLDSCVADLERAAGTVTRSRARRRRMHLQLVGVVAVVMALSAGVAGAATGGGVFAVFHTAGATLFGIRGGGSHAGFSHLISCPAGTTGVMKCQVVKDGAVAVARSTHYQLVGLVKATPGSSDQLVGGGSPPGTNQIWCAKHGSVYACRQMNGVPPSRKSDAIYKLTG